MDWAALVTWVVTAAGGAVLLVLWLKHGGMRQRERGRLRPAAILGHFALAAGGLVLWLVYLATDTTAVAWVAFALLLVVAAIGFGMFGLWVRQRRGRGGDLALEPPPPAEQRFPLAVVGLHGLLAATTLVLVFLAAAGV